VVVVLLLDEAATALARSERELAQDSLGDQDPRSPIDGCQAPETLGSLDIMTTGDPVPIMAARVFADAGANGTTGFFIDPLAPEAALQGGDSGVIIAPADPLKARLNLGVRSLEAGASFQITVRNKNGVVRNTQTKTYGPTFFEQVNANSYVGVTLDGNDTITFSVNSGKAIIYGAQTDNKTQDPSVQYAKKTF